MSKGPHVKSEVKLKIKEITRDNQNYRAKEIMQEAIDFFKDTSYFVPGVSEVGKLAKEERDSHNPKDNPWSVGECRQYEIAPEAMQDLLELWRRCTIGGGKFSNRQAIWAAKIRSAIPVMPGLLPVPPIGMYLPPDLDRLRIETLYRYATLYADMEWAAQTLNVENFDTRPIDVLIAFRTSPGSHEYWAALHALGIFELPTYYQYKPKYLKDPEKPLSMAVGLSDLYLADIEPQPTREMRYLIQEHAHNTPYFDQEKEDLALLYLKMDLDRWSGSTKEERSAMMDQAAFEASSDLAQKKQALLPLRRLIDQEGAREDPKHSAEGKPRYDVPEECLEMGSPNPTNQEPTRPKTVLGL